MEISSQKEECTTPIYENGRYRNPWKTWQYPKVGALLKFMFFTKSETKIPHRKSELDKTLPVHKPDFSHFNKSPESGIRHMWIGHASSLVQFDGITLLTDPVFSDRCAPTQWAGPQRYRPPPCTIDELPNIDAVVISHNHYDHLDYNSVVALNKRFGDKLCWYVPVGLKSWMTEQGCTNVVELTWWQEHIHSNKSQIRFVSTPSQHWCKRGLTDTDKVLWCSWSVIGPKHRFFFSGDTGYCDGFKQIGKKFGPFHLSTIPIGAYHPRSFLSPQHVDPAQAVDIHLDLKSYSSVGIHWGTFSLSHEFYLEPRTKVKEELVERSLPPHSFVTVDHGDIQIFGCENNSDPGEKNKSVAQDANL